MQVIIFTSLSDKQFLQDIMNFAKANTYVKFQMYFSKNEKQILSLIKQPNDFIITNEKSVAVMLKNTGHSGLLMKEWGPITKEFKYGI